MSEETEALSKRWSEILAKQKGHPPPGPSPRSKALVGRYGFYQLFPKSTTPLKHTINRRGSILNSQNRKRAEDALDLNRNRMLAEAEYLIGLYSSDPSKAYRVHTFNERNKIDQVIGALKTAKNVNKTNSYDGLLESLQKIQNEIRSIKEGGKRCKTRRKRRRSTRFSK